ncbi:MAG: ribulose-phosphate 3-epimerase [Negativicutes bacterium]|nr:ribulose-phosphate 3-epimerase [Negativicutes bacterium]
MKNRVAFSVLSADFAHIARDIGTMARAGIDFLHLDIMDGHFVPNLTFGCNMVAAIRKCCSLPLDVHLMVDNPGDYIAPLAEIGVEIVTVHCEADRHLDRLLQAIKKRGMKAGVALNPATPVVAVENVLYAADLVLVMSVNPGFGGQKFIPRSLEKINAVARLISSQRSSAVIEVDGGINLTTAMAVRQAGAGYLVVGSALLGQDDLAGTIRQLRGDTAAV